MDKKRSNSIRFELLDYSRIKYSFDRNISRAKLILRRSRKIMHISWIFPVNRGSRVIEQAKVESQEAGRQANAS